MESVAGIIVGQVFVVRMLCDVVLVRKKRPDTAKLENALAAVENRQLIDRSEVLPQFLIIEAVGNFAAPAFAGIIVE